MKYTLFSYWRSSCSWRVRTALAFKGVAYEYAAIHLVQEGGQNNKQDYLARNPLGQVPLLEWTENGVSRRVAQSMAIIEYLEEQFPRPALLPADPYARARARQLAEIVNSGTQPLQNIGVARWLKARGVDDKAFCQHYIAKGLAALQETARETAGKFLLGDAPTVADVFLTPQLYNARRFEVPLDAYPLLTRVEAACLALPAFQAAHPDQQPDADT